jgi:hypothetical protein
MVKPNAGRLPGVWFLSMMFLTRLLLQHGSWFVDVVSALYRSAFAAI